MHLITVASVSIAHSVSIFNAGNPESNILRSSKDEVGSETKNASINGVVFWEVRGYNGTRTRFIKFVSTNENLSIIFSEVLSSPARASLHRAADFCAH